MLELKKEKKGKWFIIPNEPFGAKTIVKLKLTPITRKELLSARDDSTETRFNKKTHQPYQYTDEKKQDKIHENNLFNAVLDWEGITVKVENDVEKMKPAEFNRENWNIFIDQYGMIKLYMEWDEKAEENVEISLSRWLSNICLDPKNFLEDDTENLVHTS